MAKKGSVGMDIRKLNQLYEGLKEKPTIQVGVFMAKTHRKVEGLSNADLAMIHEKGAPERGLPARSMLKVPLADHAQQVMGVAKGLAHMLADNGGPKRLWKLVGIAAEKVVLGAFSTGGYGKWPSLKYSTLLGKLKGSLATRRSKIGQMYAGQIGEGILIRTGQLRRAFSSRVIMRLGR